MSSARSRILIAAVAAIALSSAVALPAQAKTTDEATDTGNWQKISGGQIDPSVVPSVLRLPGSGLLAGWAQKDGNGTESIQTAVFSGSKSTLAATGAIVSGWYDLQSSPQFATINGQLLAGYFGTYTTATGDPYTGPVIGARSTDGIHWVQDAQPLSGGKAAGIYGLGLVSDGATPTTDFINTTTNVIGYHVGYSTFGATDNTALVSAGADGFVTNASLVRDSATGAIYSAWYTNGGAGQGIHAQQVAPTLGPILTAPGSSTTSQPDAVNQPLAITTTSRGGVWVGYATGSGSRSFKAWSPETGKSITVADHESSLVSPNLSAGPDGKVWAAWVSGDTINASRSNSSVTEFGAVATAKSPVKSVQPFSVTGEGSTGSLDVVVNASSAFYHTVIDPALTVSVSKASFSAKKSAKTTLTVTDAGAAVSHAVVKFNGHSYKTSSKGKLVLTVKKGLSHGSKSISATKSGFLSTVTKVTVKK